MAKAALLGGPVNGLNVFGIAGQDSDGPMSFGDMLISEALESPPK